MWVREAWAETDTADGTPVVAYRAGGCVAVGRDEIGGPDYLVREYTFAETPHVDSWRTSIHMPRWAARILLEIVSVRVERLNEISPRDAYAEGAILNHDPIPVGCTWDETVGSVTVPAFRSLWESINGTGSWAANPWVWVVEFKRVQP